MPVLCCRRGCCCCCCCVARVAPASSRAEAPYKVDVLVPELHFPRLEGNDVPHTPHKLCMHRGVFEHPLEDVLLPHPCRDLPLQGNVLAVLPPGAHLAQPSELLFEDPRKVNEQPGHVQRSVHVQAPQLGIAPRAPQQQRPHRPQQLCGGPARLCLEVRCGDAQQAGLEKPQKLLCGGQALLRRQWGVVDEREYVAHVRHAQGAPLVAYPALYAVKAGRVFEVGEEGHVGSVPGVPAAESRRRAEEGVCGGAEGADVARVQYENAAECEHFAAQLEREVKTLAVEVPPVERTLGHALEVPPLYDETAFGVQTP